MFSSKQVNATYKYFLSAIDAGVIHLSSQDIKSDGRTLALQGKEVINFAVHSYLGLETDLRLKTAAIETINNFGMNYSSSRTMLSAPQYTEFEHLLEKIFGAYIVVTQTTSLGSTSALPVLINDNDLVLVDALAHNSLRRPLKTMAGLISTKQIPHNNMEQLEKIIKRNQDKQLYNNIWYVGDGIYSHDGGACKMRELNYLLNKYDNFYAYIDDAHGCSIVGKHGRGYALSRFDSQPEKLVVAVGFSKAFGMGCGGAIILKNKEWQKKISICGPASIFSGPIPTPMLGAGIASAKIHLSPEITCLQSKLHERIAYFHYLLKKYGLNTFVGGTPYFSPIFFIKLKKEELVIKIAQRLLKKGFFIATFIYPTVAKNNAGLRVVITNHHNNKDLELLSAALAECFIEEQLEV